MSSDIKVIQDNHRLPVSAVEFKGNTFAHIRWIEFEDAAVPADTRLRIVATKRMKPFASKCRVIDKRQLDGPVVRQVSRRPVTIVERERSGWKETTRLLEIS